MIFKRIGKSQLKDSNEPKVNEIKLKKDYQFMYENFLISSQSDLYLLLEESGGLIDALRFNFLIYKYGYPNDEAMAAHPMSKYGLGFYGLYEVFNSPWIVEIRNSNRIHPRHIDKMYNDYKHYIARFKDVTLDVICLKMEELQLTKGQLIEILNKEIGFINNNAS
jgi:hypothetical protein